ncbi:MAG: SDR family oxidoreductase [Candidatus Zixiibacteriota bacterium]
MTPLKDKTILITGASAGIGAATAHAFAREGARLILAARRMDRLQGLAEELKQSHDTEAICLRLDLRQHKSVGSELDKLPDNWRGIDILVNNGGLSRGLDKLHGGNPDDWDEMIDVNIRGLLAVSRAVIPWMVKRGSGHVINLGSIAGHEVYPNGNVYCATKFAVRALTKGMMLDLFGTPIRVTSIDPGMVETEFSLVRFHGDRERAAKVYKGTTPLTGDDVAEAIVWAANRPAHVNIAEMLILPTVQRSTGLLYRET